MFRILENDNYIKKGKIGVFKSLFYILLFLSTIFVFIISIFIFKANLIDILYLIIYYILLSIRIYYIAAFRIDNNLYFSYGK